MDAKIKFDKVLSLEDTLKISDRIFKHIKDKKLSKDDAKAYISANESEFKTTFPIVADFMSIGEYNRDAMEHFLRYYAKEAKKDDIGSIAEIQSEYPAFILKQRNRNITMEKFREMREEYRRAYRKERDSLVKNIEKYKAEYARETAEHRAELIKKICDSVAADKK